MAKYIRCDGCGKRIELGQEVYVFPGYCGIYCDAVCFAYAYGDCIELDENVAANCCREIYDDDEDKRKLEADIARAEAEIEELKRKLEVNKILLTQYA